MRSGRPYTMSIVVVLILLVTAAPALASDSCISCHLELGGSLGKPSEIFENDIHHQVGLSCASCHGGDPSNNDMEGAKASGTGYAGAPSFKKISDFCGSCHSSAEFMRQYNPSLRIDQVSEYRTSVHGKSSAEGNTDVATCISCHSVPRHSEGERSAVARISHQSGGYLWQLPLRSQAHGGSWSSP